MNRIDIIIPIYNALDCLKECINTIIKNTDLQKNGLILINDKSPDNNVNLYLDELKEKYSNLNITVLSNDVNLGFVGTVNKGMKYSENDVLLLNSDTEVPKNWLTRIWDCAYSDKTIGTVTALSNNATLVSVPKPLQPNDIPNDITFEEFADIVHDAAYNDYLDLPTSHGFCMFIKREVLDLIGFFDEENFGKGYGEENDFSFRCLDFGYRNVVCDNVIVLHKESQSFKDDKDDLLKHNLKVLHNRYPAYSQKIDLWLKQYPLKKNCENIFYNLNLRKKENILFVIHDFSNPYTNIGGTTVHCMDIIRKLRYKYNFHVLYPENGVYKVYSFFDDEEKLVNLGSVYSTSSFSYYNNDYRKIIQKVIDGLWIDVVHIHHMMGHFFDIIDICNEKNIKSIITLHDFYSLCPTVNMLYNMEKCCLYLDEKDCKACLYNKMRLNNNILSIWNKRWADFLMCFDNILTPSQSTKEIIENTYSNISCQVIEHGVSYKKITSYLKNTDLKFNVAFVGVMAKHKGAEVIEKLIRETNDKNIIYHLFGKSEYKSLENNSNNYIYHGQYKRDDLQKMLKDNDIHLVCNLSIWPETYSYTLTETIASGIPVLALDYGAVAERINKYGFGWVLEKDVSVQEICKAIINIKNNKFDYKLKIDNLNNYHLKSIDEMCNEYYKMYKIIERKPFNNEALRELIASTQEKFNGSDFSQLDEILNSRRWKFISKIELPEPLKKVVRKIIK